MNHGVIIRPEGEDVDMHTAVYSTLKCKCGIILKIPLNIEKFEYKCPKCDGFIEVNRKGINNGSTDDTGQDTPKESS
jgi:hypothetical protein